MATAPAYGAPRSCGVVMKSNEILIKLIAFMARQAHHERNQYITVRPELVEGLNQSFPKGKSRCL